MFKKIKKPSHRATSIFEARFPNKSMPLRQFSQVRALTHGAEQIFGHIRSLYALAASSLPLRFLGETCYSVQHHPTITQQYNLPECDCIDQHKLALLLLYWFVTVRSGEHSVREGSRHRAQQVMSADTPYYERDSGGYGCFSRTLTYCRGGCGEEVGDGFAEKLILFWLCAISVRSSSGTSLRYV